MGSRKNKWDSSPKHAPDAYPAERLLPKKVRGRGPLERRIVKRGHSRRSRRWRLADLRDRVAEARQ